MRILLVGASGRTGRLVLDGALTRGHAVTAMVRGELAVAPAKGLTVVQGDVLSASDLQLAIPGCDVVVSVLGRRTKADRNLLQDGAQAMLAALPPTGVDRYIVVSQGLLFPSRSPIIALLRRVLATAIADSTAMERLVRASQVQWTVVRPPRLKDDDGPRGYRASVDARPKGALSMGRSDLAAFLLDEAEQARFGRAVVGLG